MPPALARAARATVQQRPLATAAARVPSLKGSVAWVVGGAGIIGRGICRGLLRAGATVIISSRFTEGLAAVEEHLDYPANLITVQGTMQVEGAAALLTRAMENPQLSGRQIKHVVAHSGVRWWAKDGSTDETRLLEQKKNLSLLKTEPTAFAQYAMRLPSLHHSAAQQLLPHLLAVEGSSYTIVTGGSGSKRSAIDQVNNHGVWGLAEAMREEFRESPVRVEELRVSLEINRLAKEKELDPRPAPLSYDIGEVCAGMATNALGWAQNPVFHSVDSNDDILMLKVRYPSAHVIDIE